MSEVITFAAPLAIGIAAATPRKYSNIVALLLSITGFTVGILGVIMEREGRQAEAQVASTAGSIFSLVAILKSIELV